VAALEAAVVPVVAAAAGAELTLDTEGLDIAPEYPPDVCGVLGKPPPNPPPPKPVEGRLYTGGGT